MFTFPIAAIRMIIVRGKRDAAVHGGYRDPYMGEKPGEGEKPGFWLVGDHGVYVMSNGRLADDQKPLVVYAEECNPETNDDWWDYKNRYFGGDDGVEFIDADQPLVPFSHITDYPVA